MTLYSQVNVALTLPWSPALLRRQKLSQQITTCLKAENNWLWSTHTQWINLQHNSWTKTQEALKERLGRFEGPGACLSGGHKDFVQSNNGKEILVKRKGTQAVVAHTSRSQTGEDLSEFEASLVKKQVPGQPGTSHRETLSWKKTGSFDCYPLLSLIILLSYGIC